MIRSAAVLALVLLSSLASAATLSVGPGQTYSTPCAAIAAAQLDDVVEIAPGTYTDTCAIAVAGLTVRGVGGRPKIVLSGTDHPAQYKGIYVIAADGVTVENLELMGAHISTANGSNGAGLRIQANDATVRRCYVHDNQNGILASPRSSGTGTLTIEYSEFDHNGFGDGCTGSGCTHNLYIGDFAKLVFRHNWTHDLAHDFDDKGHLLKSRAYESQILYNRITGEGGHDSYEIDLPNGGLAIVVGNLVEKGPNPDNFSLLTYGLEGLLRPDKRLFVVNNTFVNDASKGTFVNVAAGGALTAHNNLFVGPGTLSTTGALSADNLRAEATAVVDAPAFDYRLREGSSAIDRGVDPGSADAFLLTPTEQYVHPTSGEARVTSGGAVDIGAYEFAQVPVEADAGIEPADAGIQDDAGAADAGTESTDASIEPSIDAGDPKPIVDAGSEPTVESDAAGGCGCSASSDGVSALAAAAFALACVSRRRAR